MTKIESLPLDWDKAAIAARRQRYLAPALGTFVAYDDPVVWRRGSGQYVWDEHGRRFLDCMAQNVCVSVGHAHPGVLAAVREQMEQLPHVTTAYHHPQPGHFAEELVARLPQGPDWVVHFVNSGSEAIDLAVLIARASTRHFEVLTLRDAYHGMQYGAQTATGLGQARQPVPPAPGYVQVIAPHPYRGPFGAGAEPYLEELRRRCWCAACGGLLIVDEVQTGSARTGDHFWGFEAHGVVPDVIVTSKGIANGFPLAAVITRRDLAQGMAARMFFNTYGSNPSCCAAGRAVLRAIESEGLQANAREVGGLILSGLRELQQRDERLGDVRGRGLLIGAEVVKDGRSREADARAAERIQLALLERGIVVGLCGREHNVVKINPPLCVNSGDATVLLEAMQDALARL